MLHGVEIMPNHSSSNHFVRNQKFINYSFIIRIPDSRRRILGMKEHRYGVRPSDVSKGKDRAIKSAILIKHFIHVVKGQRDEGE